MLHSYRIESKSNFHFATVNATFQFAKTTDTTYEVDTFVRTKVFETKNITTLMRSAQVLGVSLDYLIKGDMGTEEQNSVVNGFVEVNGTVYRLRSKEDMVRVLELL